MCFVRGCIVVLQAESTREIPVYLVSCDKRRISGALEPQHSNVDSLFDLRGRIHI